MCDYSMFRALKTRERRRTREKKGRKCCQERMDWCETSYVPIYTIRGSIETWKLGNKDVCVCDVMRRWEMRERRRKWWRKGQIGRQERKCRCAMSFGPICTIQESIQSG